MWAKPRFRHAVRVLALALPAAFLFAACSSGGGAEGSAGSTGSATSGASSLGGAPIAGSGGLHTGSAGAPASGGMSGAGVGGTPSSAGSPPSGGASATAGTGATGATGATGGSLGGSSSGMSGGPGNACASVTCGTGQTCSNGTCMCSSGTLCSGTCVDTQSDQNHCGTCTTACDAAGACVSGKCVNPTCNPDTQQRSGHITTYNLATAMVACHYPTSTLPQYYGAMNEYDWNNSGVCGACVEITNTQNQKKLTVQITDECPYKGNEQWCFQGSHHIDLNGSAYSALGANNNPATTWKYVPCSTTGNLKYYFDTACQQYYLAVTPMNAQNLVAKMEVLVKGAYVALSPTNYHTYELTTGAGTGALTFRLTDIYNHVVTDTVTMTAGQVVQGTKQFAACP